MPYAITGSTITASLTGAPQGLVGTLTAELRQLPDGTVLVPATVDGITEFPQEDGETSNYAAAIAVPVDAPNGPAEVQWGGAPLSIEPDTDWTIVGQPAPIDVRARLERMLRPDLDPTLTDAEVDDLLAGAKRTDADGLAPSDPAWTPTYDLDQAAADGWEAKAGKAATGFDFGEDGQRFNRSQLFDQCMKMAALYRRGKGQARNRSSVLDDDVEAAFEGLTPLSTLPSYEVIE